jgi:hypothetical protein
MVIEVGVSNVCRTNEFNYIVRSYAASQDVIDEKNNPLVPQQINWQTIDAVSERA